MNVAEQSNRLTSRSPLIVKVIGTAVYRVQLKIDAIAISSA